VALVTVPEEGAAEVVRSALEEVGIPVRLERAYPEDPYRGSVFAGAWKVLVPEERLAEAQVSLERVEREMAEEVEAQAASFQPEAPSPSPPVGRPRKVTWALALAFLLPLPVVCFYARAWRRGAVWLGLSLAAVALLVAAIAGFRLKMSLESPLTYGDRIALLYIWAKVTDLFVGVLLIVLGRRPALPA